MQPPTPPAPPNLANGRAVPIDPNGADVQGNVDRGSATLYSLAATAGATYDIEVQPGTLSDTVLEIWDSDRHTFETMNDDANGGLGSAISFSPPASGTYYLAVRAYSSSMRGSFTITVTGSG
eukprot:SAG31_NODE_1211_length_9376_cov_2.931767_11_plen_121_part_01